MSSAAPTALSADPGGGSKNPRRRGGEGACNPSRASHSNSQGAPGAVADGRLEQQLRHSMMWVISIGTNEIQRTLIAQRGLGLPR